jgi:hypothetical protein
MTATIYNFDLPVERSSIIKVLGIGGEGTCSTTFLKSYREFTSWFAYVPGIERSPDCKSSIGEC